MSEFDLIEERLRAYRPVGPSPAVREGMAVVLGGLQSGAPGRARTGRWRGGAIAASVLAVLALGAYALWPKPAPALVAPATASNADSRQPPIPSEFATAWAAKPRVDIPWVSSRASVTVVTFMDWQCPACLTLYPTLELVAERYKKSHSDGVVDVVMVDWPWNSDCNVQLRADPKAPRHEASCVAAAAVRIARSRGQADAMIGWILADRSALSGEGWRSRILAEIQRLLPGIDFDKEYQGVLLAIESEAARGAALHVNMTPSVFVNGRLIGPQVPSAEVLDWAIRLELQRAEKIK